MYQVLLCTCRAIVLLIKAFVLPRRRRRCRRGLVPNDLTIPIPLPIPKRGLISSLYKKKLTNPEVTPLAQITNDKLKKCSRLNCSRCVRRDGA